jgi:hypothetical protein
LEFWTCAIDYSVDKETISTLYQNNLLNITTCNKDQEINNQEINNETKFWKSFSQSIKKNKRGFDGKQRILSIIAEEFGPTVLYEKLQVLFYLIKYIYKSEKI